jgi:hypothetical protein
VAINVFEGARRILGLLVGLWVLGSALVYWNDMPGVQYTVVIERPADLGRQSHKPCPDDAAERREFSRKTRAGTKYDLSLCFPLAQFDAGRFVPYLENADGSYYWGGPVFDEKVSAYTNQRLASFVAPPLDEEWIDSQEWSVWKTAFASWLKVALGGWLVLVIAGVTVGWIVRGFLGIPTGRDFREVPTPPEDDDADDDD